MTEQEKIKAVFERMLGESNTKPKDKNFQIKKSEDDKMRVFGWGQVAVRKDGTVIEDWQGDIVDPEDLEEAAYFHVLNFRKTGEQHNAGLREKGQLIESVILTKEKQEAMGIPEGTVPIGWWVGYQIEDPETWKKLKSGEYAMFSVEGTGKRVPIEPEVQKSRISRYLEAIQKFNPYHDSKGRFTSGNSAISFSLPKDQKQADKWKQKEGERARNAARENEKKFLNNDFETLHWYDQNGNLIKEKPGGSNYVQIAPDELETMKNAIVSHNHPNGSSFSPEDINIFVKGDLAEMRATRPNGEVFSIRKKELKPYTDKEMEMFEFTNTSAPTEVERRKSLASMFKMANHEHTGSIKDEMDKFVPNLMANGKMSQDQANEMFRTGISEKNIKWLQDNASKFGAEFVWEGK